MARRIPPPKGTFKFPGTIEQYLEAAEFWWEEKGDYKGFKEEFGEWMSNILDVPFKVEDVPYKELGYDEENKLERTAKLLDNVRNLHRRDLETLYPELAPS